MPAGPAVIDVPPQAMTSERVHGYAALTEDANPIHLDGDFAARSAFGGPIVHGTLLLAPVWAALVTQFGARALTHAHVACRFVRPVRTGCVVHIRGELQSADDGALVYAFVVRTEPDLTHAVVDVRLAGVRGTPR